MRYLYKFAALAACLLMLGIGQLRAAPSANGVLVFVAASASDVAKALGQRFFEKRGIPVTISPAASPTLARQIENGAPASLFLSADQRWMDYLAERKLIRSETRFDLMTNRVVLIAPRTSTLTGSIAPGFPLLSWLKDGRLATCDENVPIGAYAKAALEYLGVWTSVAPRLARAENARAALAFVERGEAPLGIVFATDAQASSKVKVIDVFPAESHPPAVYPVALTANGNTENAKAFLDFLKSDEAQAIIRARGFDTVSP